MQLTIATLVAAFAAVGLAKPVLTNSAYDIKEDVPFNITWGNAVGLVTVTLVNGPSGNLKPFAQIVNVPAGTTSFVWTPSDIPSDTYAIEISDQSGSDNLNYSPQFQYFSSTVESSSSSSSASSTSTSSASSTTPSSSASTTDSSTTITSSASTSSGSSSTTSAHSSTTTTARPTTTPSTNTNEGQRFNSPLALLLVTVAAVVFFN
ncbi:hypothetical protein B0T17DRAFT_331756 [Bombardia bombarda]|uniref:Ser-Thr-rich glycosyl-phosphatidyl-inositol-anchored membrane family-domain-containing protein n=1 Tax=Bombardia bombarda TaxID=252184 RepID=A0AA39WMU9_9PEZI|nr:hypothetical protein B0T17DRAFT_331756 [Bombardia bombarda]